MMESVQDRGEDGRERREVAAGASARARLFDNFVVVLNETQNLVNLAGSIRAMMNMGIRRVRLVRPAEFEPKRITGIAHGSAGIVADAEFYDTLREAVSDAVHVVATTARRRSARYVWEHPRDAAPALVEIAAADVGPVALVFGREDAGLSNEELDLCDRTITVPTDSQHWSLNLAQAVLLVSYELWMAGGAGERPLPHARRREERPPTNTELLSLFEETENALHTIDFFKKRNPAAIMRTVHAVARRAGMDIRELKLLRAMAYEVQKYVRRITRQDTGSE